MTRLLAGRYELIRTVGAGGQGTVHLAADLETERLVALKRRHVDSLAPATPLAVSSVPRHPGVVELLGEVEALGTRWLVMEWVDGQDLRTRVERLGPLPTGDALVTVAEIAAALVHLHGEGLVHGDVKPSNVVTGVDGRCVLVDLGSTGPHHRSGAFSAPERGREMRPAADVWSLAATAVHLLAGAPPAIGRPVPWPDDVPPAVASVLTGALDLDPTRRPSAAAVGEVVRHAGACRTRPRATVEDSSLIGRAAELSWLAQTLGQGLVTITGAAGVGKSVLAREVVRAATGTSDVVWIDAGELDAVDDLSRHLAAGAGIEPGAGDLQSMVDALRARRAIVVIDGADALAERIGRDLGRCTLDGLALVVTSTRPLGVPDESILEVAPLAVPRGDSPGAVIASPAGRLLLRRCRERDTIAHLDAEAAARLAGAARAAEGVPLALELAATDPAAAGSHLAASLQRAIAALPDDLRAVLVGLSAFRGPFTLEDAGVVLDRALAPSPSGWADSLDRLRARSLLGGDGTGAFRLLRAVRELASGGAEPAQRAAARRAHASWARGFVECLAAREAGGVRSPSGTAEVARRRRDLMAAVDELLREDAAAGCRTLLGLAPTLVDLGPDAELDRLFEAAQHRLPEVADLPLWRARIAHHQGRLDDALALLHLAGAIGGDDETWRMIHRLTGHVHADRLAWDLAEAEYRAGLACARRRGDLASESLQLVDVASVLAVSGRPDEARELNEEAVALAQRAEVAHGLVLALVQLAAVLPDHAAPSDIADSHDRRPATAREALATAAAVAERVGSDALVALSHPSLAMSYLRDAARATPPDLACARRGAEVAEEGRRASEATASNRGLGISEFALALAAGFEDRDADEAHHLRQVRRIVGRPEVRPHLWAAFLIGTGLSACRRARHDEAAELLVFVERFRPSLGQTPRPDGPFWDVYLRRRLREVGAEPSEARCPDDPDRLADSLLD